jgi:hypothetical protein
MEKAEDRGIRYREILRCCIFAETRELMRIRKQATVAQVDDRNESFSILCSQVGGSPNIRRITLFGIQLS